MRFAFIPYAGAVIARFRYTLGPLRWKLHEGDRLIMKLPGFSTLKSVLPVIALLLVPAAIPVMAQSDSSGAPATTQSGGSQSTSRQSASTTTRTEVQPVQNATRVDPMWLMIGGAAVIALLIIVVLAMRGRDTDTVSRERTTVIKE
jgi:hypothetical protein